MDNIKSQYSDTETLEDTNFKFIHKRKRLDNWKTFQDFPPFCVFVVLLVPSFYKTYYVLDISSKYSLKIVGNRYTD